MRYLRRISIWLLAILATLIAIYAIVGFFVVPKIGLAKAEEIGSEALGMPIQLESVSFNPFTLRLGIDGLKVGEGDTQLFSAESLAVDVSVLGSITSRHYELDELKIVAPKGSLVINTDGSMNLPQAKESEDAGVTEVKEEPKTDFELPAVQIDSFVIEGGALAFEDHRLSPVFRREFTPIDLDLSEFSTRNEAGKLKLAATGDAGEELNLTCELTSIQPLKIASDFSLQGLTVDGHRPFIQPHTKAIISSGTLGLSAKVECQLLEDSSTPSIIVSDGIIDLRDLVIKHSEDDTAPNLITIPELGIKGIAVNVAEQKVTIGNVLLNAAEFDLKRDSEGEINLVQQLVPTSETEPEKEKPAQEELALDTETPAAKSWVVELKALDIAGCQVHYQDAEMQLDLPLGIDLNITDFVSTLDQSSKFQLSLTGPNEASIKSSGDATIQPLLVNADLDLQHISPDLVPSIIDQFLNVETLGGELSLKASVQCKANPSTESPEVQVSDGELEIINLIVKQTESDPCINIPKLHATGINVDQPKLLASIASIQLDQGTSLVHLDPEGLLNFQTLATAGESEEEEAPEELEEPAESNPDAAPAPSWNVKVGKLAVTDHQLRYRDEGDLDLDFPINLGFEVSDFDLNEGSLKIDGGLGLHSAALQTNLALTLDPLAIEGTLALESLQPADFLDIIQRYVKIETATGRIDAKVDLNYSDGKAIINDASLDIIQVEFSQKDQDAFLKLPKVEIAKVALDQTTSDLSIGTLLFEEPFLGVTKDSEGMINIKDLLVERKVSDESKEAPTATESEEEASAPLRIQLEKAQLTKALLHYTETDRVDLPIQFDLSVGGVSSKGGSGDVSFNAMLLGDGDEALDIATTLDLKTGDGEGDIFIKGIDFGIVEPWLPTLPFQIAARGIDYDGNIKFANVLTGAPEFDTGGQLAIRKFALNETGSEPFVSCDDVQFGTFSFTYPENVASLESITLTDLDLDVEIFEDGKLNLVRAFSSDSPESEKASSKEASGTSEGGGLELDLGRLTITESRIGFIDRSIQPNFTKALEDFELQIADVRVGEKNRAKFNLTGSLDHHAPLQINGFYDDRISKRFPEWHLIAKNVFVDEFAPYTKKFFGRDIETGAMSLKQDIDLTDDKLEGELKFFFAKLKVGEVVESPDLINIPFGPALFVLSRNGRIDEEIKFSGDPNDPSFHFGPVFANALGNVVKKIALMPAGMVTRFTQGIAGLFQDRGKKWIVDHFEFPDGSAQLTPEIRSKLDQVAVAPLEAEAFDDLRVSMPEGIPREAMDKLAGRRVSAIRKYLMERHNLDPHRVLGMQPGAFPGSQPEVEANKNRYIFWIERLDTYKAGSQSSAKE